jgi:hydroxymethylpyrimidine/phosphomethylpyrimidine kinase
MKRSSETILVHHLVSIKLKPRPPTGKKRSERTQPVVLSIAGYDPSSGAGITADIKTIAAHGCYGVTCITALTVQSTQGVRRVEPVRGDLITETLDKLAADVEIAAVKIGMLGSGEAAHAVAAFLTREKPRYVVLDPILKSSSGAPLLSADGVRILKDNLLRSAFVVTPNTGEAATLTGMTVANLDQMAQAAENLRALGARNVIVTGGHLESTADLIHAEFRRRPLIFKGKRIITNSTHGTGCAFSTALACNLARGQNLIQAAKSAKDFVEAALRNPPGVGKGAGPVV